MITDFDALVIFGCFFLATILLFIKVYFHFEYLKFEKGKFRNIDSLLHLYFRPWRAFECLDDLFIVIWVPVFTYGKSARKKKVFILTWMVIVFFGVAIVDGSIRLL